jgi:hypothetical protein
MSMFIWDIAPWMRQTTVQLNSMAEMLEAVAANQSLMMDMIAQLQPKDLSPEQQKTLNEIYERSMMTRAKMEAVKRT